MSSLSPTARVILGMLKLGVRTGYDIKKAIDFSTQFFWSASYGQIYPELKRLREAGLVRARSQLALARSAQTHRAELQDIVRGAFRGGNAAT